jgi:hypothetical protein
LGGADRISPTDQPTINQVLNEIAAFLQSAD